jgi:hypothetical protein
MPEGALLRGKLITPGKLGADRQDIIAAGVATGLGGIGLGAGRGAGQQQGEGSEQSGASHGSLGA